VKTSIITFVLLGILSIIPQALAISIIQPCGYVDIHGFLNHVEDFDQYFHWGSCYDVVTFYVIDPPPDEGVYLKIEGLDIDGKVVDAECIAPSSFVWQVELVPENGTSIWYVKITYLWWSGDSPALVVEYYGDIYYTGGPV